MWPQRSPSSEVMCRRSKRVRRTRALGLRTRHYRSKTTSVILACCHSRLLIVAGRSLRWRGEPAPLPCRGRRPWRWRLWATKCIEIHFHIWKHLVIVYILQPAKLRTPQIASRVHRTF